MAAIFALALVGFAHSAATTTVQRDAAYAAQYALPDGTVPILCQNGQSDQGHAAFIACSFCLIASAVDLPTVDLTAAQLSAFPLDIVFASGAAHAAVATIRLSDAGPRGPPIA